jgi:1,4-dihydroxy-2-naphthoate octaprenyltransferase
MVWMAAARPKTLPAAGAPVLVGTAMAAADGRFHAASAAGCLLFAILIQVGTNYCNDLADYLKGADTKDRLGPLRMTQAGLVAPGAMRAATMLVFAAAAAIGTALVVRAGWPLISVVVLSVLFGILYTAGPLPLGYLGLGEIFVLLFFGPVAVAGTYTAQALEVSGPSIAAGLGPGLLSVAILVVNNLRDADQDARAGKRTLAVRFGKPFARIEYAACVVGAAAVPGWLWLCGSDRPLSLLALLVLVPGLAAVRTIFSETDSARLNPMLGRTAAMLLAYSILFSAGWLAK